MIKAKHPFLHLHDSFIKVNAHVRNFRPQKGFCLRFLSLSMIFDSVCFLMQEKVSWTKLNLSQVSPHFASQAQIPMIRVEGNWMDPILEFWNGFLDTDQQLQIEVNPKQSSKSLSSRLHMKTMWNLHVNPVWDNDTNLTIPQNLSLVYI